MKRKTIPKLSGHFSISELQTLRSCKPPPSPAASMEGVLSQTHLRDHKKFRRICLKAWQILKKSLKKELR